MITNDGIVELETIYIEPGSTQLRYVASDNPGKLAVVSVVLPPRPNCSPELKYWYPDRFKELDPDNAKKWLFGGHDVAAFELLYTHPVGIGQNCGVWGTICYHAGRGQWFAEVASEAPHRKSTTHVTSEFFSDEPKGIYKALAWFTKELTESLKLLIHCGFDAEKAQAGAPV